MVESSVAAGNRDRPAQSVTQIPSGRQKRQSELRLTVRQSYLVVAKGLKKLRRRLDATRADRRLRRLGSDMGFGPESRTQRMYESFFGLRKRPYAAAPGAEILVETPGVADAVTRLDRCVREGRGIGVLTAAAGMGKTHLCHCLARRWEEDFRTVVLPNAGFPTRRGILQSILAELDQPYQRLSEAELRLELSAACRAMREMTSGVVLLFDEAHRHSERILEEIRLIANLVDGGEPLVRIVLSGHLELEERLADPGLAGLNERVGELVTLPRLTAEEARVYLRERASFAGSALESLFEADAVEVMVQACGGVPRCLNQLADHGLLLGYVAERRPVDQSLVREALDDLKRLPLHWHDPLPTSGSDPERERANETSEPFASDLSGGFDGMIEVGGAEEMRSSGWESSAGVDAEPHFAASELSAFEVGAPEAFGSPTRESFPQAIQAQLPKAETESIRDRFARLDAAAARRRWADLVEQGVLDLAVRASDRSLSEIEEPRFEARPTANPLEILDRIEPLIAEALAEDRAFGTLSPDRQEVSAGVTTVARLDAEITSSVSTAKTIEAQHAPRIHVRQSTLFSDLRRRGGGSARPGNR